MPSIRNCLLLNNYILHSIIFILCSIRSHPGMKVFHYPYHQSSWHTRNFYFMAWSSVIRKCGKSYFQKKIFFFRVAFVFWASGWKVPSQNISKSSFWKNMRNFFSMFCFFLGLGLQSVPGSPNTHYYRNFSFPKWT